MITQREEATPDRETGAAAADTAVITTLILAFFLHGENATLGAGQGGSGRRGGTRRPVNHPFTNRFARQLAS